MGDYRNNKRKIEILFFLFWLNQTQKKLILINYKGFLLAFLNITFMISMLGIFCCVLLVFFCCKALLFLFWDYLNTVKASIMIIFFSVCLVGIYFFFAYFFMLQVFWFMKGLSCNFDKEFLWIKMLQTLLPFYLFLWFEDRQIAKDHHDTFYNPWLSHRNYLI